MLHPIHSLNVLPPTLIEASAALHTRFRTAATDAGVTGGVPDAVLQTIFACSPFVADYAVREPAEFLANWGPGAAAPRSRADYAALLHASLRVIEDEEQIYRALRRLRYRELVRIACLDLKGMALPQVLAELSALADAILSATLDWLVKQWAPRFGQPCDDTGELLELLVLAMGKLGGEELNFSSDIDLIFLYRGPGETRGGRRILANQEYFDRLGKQLIGLLNDTTADGFVYRVDMRLRPFGESGALTVSLGALEHYYQVHGRDWERYALIKGRVVQGEERDIQTLESITRPFVYRRYLDFGALAAVREMKALIDTEVAKHGLAHDVKRGPGGIREIEFIGQLFQLTRGGREPRLRQRSIVTVLQVCAELDLLSQNEVIALRAAYQFLRITEHRLQQVHDAQTQELPHTQDESARLAYGMGFATWSEFAVELARHRTAVGQVFAALFATTVETPALPTELWSNATDLDRPQALLASAGFADGARAQEILARLTAPRLLDRLSEEARSRLERLLPTLVVECARHLEGAEVLARVAALVQAVARRSVYLALLSEHPNALRRLVDLCAASPWIARELTASPILLDELLDSRNLFAPPVRAVLEAELTAALESVEPDDFEAMMDRLRQFKHQQVLRVAASDLMQGFPVAEVSNHLTWLAEVLIERARGLAWQALKIRHGVPLRGGGARTRRSGFTVIAYGKLGGLELGYGSDLDLVFLHDGADHGYTDGAKPLATDVFFTRLAQRIIHLLATRTPAGTAYELDMRLRPSGAAGLIVTSLAAFAAYQRHNAWTWEHQALVRARALGGAPALRARFESLRREILALPRAPLTLQTDIASMRSRMRHELDRGTSSTFDLKQGIGGITDIEFMVQYAVLRWAARYPILCAYTDNLRLLELIADLGLFSRAQSAALHAAYFAYRADLHRCALQEIDGLVENTRFTAERRAVAAAWARVLGG